MDGRAVEFFIPEVTSEESEKMYETFAAFAGCVPQQDGQRIQSITWTKDTVETWTAEAGKQLSGKRDVVKGRGATRREFSEPLRDGATVHAIFPGSPYRVVTDKGINPKVRSEWANPFMASSNPGSIIKFEARSAPDGDEKKPQTSAGHLGDEIEGSGSVDL